MASDSTNSSMKPRKGSAYESGTYLSPNPPDTFTSANQYLAPLSTTMQNPNSQDFFRYPDPAASAGYPHVTLTSADSREAQEADDRFSSVSGVQNSIEAGHSFNNPQDQYYSPHLTQSLEPPWSYPLEIQDNDTQSVYNPTMQFQLPHQQPLYTNYNNQVHNMGAPSSGHSSQAPREFQTQRHRTWPTYQSGDGTPHDTLAQNSLPQMQNGIFAYQNQHISQYPTREPTNLTATHNEQLGEGNTSPQTDCWVIEICPLERLRLGLPRYHSPEDQRLALQQTDTNYETVR